MRKHSVFFIIALMFFSASVLAQKNLQKGFIVTTKGDTLRGFIDQKEWLKSPDNVSFAPTKASALTTYAADDIRYFQVDGKAYYRKFIVSVSMDKVSVENFDKSADPAVIDTILLKIILIGKNVNLYTYKDRIKTRYYLQEKDQVPQELLYRMFSRPSPSGPGRLAVTQEIYKSQLLQAGQNAGIANEILTSQIRRISYGENIVDVAEKINGDQNISLNTRRQLGFNWYGGAGINRSYMTYKSNPGWNPSSASSYNPYIAVGTTIFGDRDVRKTAVRAELSWNTASIHTTAANNTNTFPESIDYMFTQSAIGLSINLQYSFYRSTNLSVMVIGGVKTTKYSYSKNLYAITDGGNTSLSSDFFALSKSMEFLNFGVAAMFKNRVEFVVNLNTPLGGFNEYAPVWSEYLHTMRFGVNYVFWGK